MASQTPRIIMGKTILRVLALLILALLLFDLAVDMIGGSSLSWWLHDKEVIWTMW